MKLAHFWITALAVSFVFGFGGLATAQEHPEHPEAAAYEPGAIL